MVRKRALREEQGFQSMKTIYVGTGSSFGCDGWTSQETDRVSRYVTQIKQTRFSLTDERFRPETADVTCL